MAINEISSRQLTYRKLTPDKAFKPCPVASGDECFANGIFEFNISRLLMFVQAHPEIFSIENIRIDELTAVPSDHLDEEIVTSADLSKPILLAEISPEHFNVIDGNHRLEKARRRGLKSLPAYRIPAEQHISFLTSARAHKTYIDYWNKKIQQHG